MRCNINQQFCYQYHMVNAMLQPLYPLERDPVPTL
jgi:hypothetical protein